MAVGRGFHLAKRTLTMLCIGLSLVFAAASAASVLDRAEHATATPHWHDLHLASSIVADDHHHHADAEHEHEDASQDRLHPGHGHHHVDAPTALASPLLTLTEAGPGIALDTPSQASRSLEGLTPAGLERPPRRTASLA